MKIDQYEDRLIALANEIIGFLIHQKIQKPDAEDIVQDVFVKLMQTDLMLPPDKLRPWLYRVALSRFYDLYRRQKKYRDVLLSQYAQYCDIVPEYSENTDLHHALAALNDYQKSLILLYYDERQRIREIAMIYNVSEAKIKVDLFRTRQQLKQFIAEEKNA